MFEEFQKMARLTRDCVITEKIDGTNAQIEIVKASAEPGATPITSDEARFVIAANLDLGCLMFAGSRTRYITPESDNFGFAAWVKAHADELWALGEGRHFGEWWGSGIQRGYGLTEKRFSLFNVARWADERERDKYPTDRPPCCGVVPVLYTGLFSTAAVEECIDRLREDGSFASCGFDKPEGVVVWHEAARIMFKKTLEKDAEGKEQKARRQAVTA